MENTKIKLGGLWKNESKDGKTYLSGSFTYGTKILIFPNGFKESEKDPDHIMYLAKTEKKAQDDDTPDEQETPF